ncbi:MAG: hypothetical protein ACTS2F_14425 [Thainema sp.]
MRPETRSLPTFQGSRYLFSIAWIAATTLGFMLSLTVVVVGERSNLGLWQGLLGGGIVGLFQDLVLMGYGLRSGWWIVANALAWGVAGASSIGVVGWFAPDGLSLLSARLIYGAFDGLKIGVMTGFVQWFAIRQTVPRFSTWWIAWNAFAWMIGLAAGWAIARELRQVTNLFVSEVFGLVITWLIVGLINGIVLGRNST